MTSAAHCLSKCCPLAKAVESETCVEEAKKAPEVKREGEKSAAECWTLHWPLNIHGTHGQRMCRWTHLGWSTGCLDSAGSLITNTPAGEMPQVSQRGSGVRGKVPNSQSFPEHSNIYPFPSTFHLRLNQSQTCHREEQAPASLMLPGCSDVCLLTRSHLLSQSSVL